MGKKAKLSIFEEGTLGLHLTINGPRTPLPASARIYRRFLQNGLRLDTDQLNALVTGRDQGILAIISALRTLAPDLGPLTMELAPKIADYLLDKSLDSHLSLEAPTALDRIAQRDEVLSAAFGHVPANGSPLEQALSAGKLGVSLTIHFNPEDALLGLFR
jgi:hypothetical protein